MSLIAPLLISSAALVSVGGTGWYLKTAVAQDSQKKSIEFIDKHYGQSKISPVVSMSDRLQGTNLTRQFAAVARRFTRSRDLLKLQSRMEYAGFPAATALERVLNAKTLSSLGGLVIGLLMILAWGWLGLALTLVLVLGGFWLPDLYVYNLASHRTEEISDGLPDAIDLLTLCVESGLGFQAALAQISATQEGPVADEFSRVLREMQLGQSRHAALTSLANRTKQEDLLRFTAAMIQVDRLGVPITSVLREQSEDMRSRRRDRAKEAAQKVPVKILLPVILCFLPGIMIIAVGPAALSVMTIFNKI
jgi:tight adherence protein C